MRKTMSLLLALTIALSGVLAGCGETQTGQPEGGEIAPEEPGSPVCDAEETPDAPG